MAKLWWHDAVVYQIYPRSFADSNNDGEGDFNGISSRLEYVAQLGADAIWFSPFYKSPNKDGGYDVANPREVDPRFGTLDDFKTMMAKANQLGLKVVVDIVPNHFSSEHEWFKAALATSPGSAERARFHFYDGRGQAGEIPPNNWQSIFGGPSWTRVVEPDGTLGQWYLHLFDASQPDLNWNNPEVHADFEETLRFWLDLGVDGFRIDVAHGLAKDEIYKDHPDPDGLMAALRLDLNDIDSNYRNELLSDIPFFDREGIHTIYKNWRKLMDSYPGEQFFVAEAWVYPSHRAARYVRPDELHQIFNFDFLNIAWQAAPIRAAIERTLADLGEVEAPPTWVLSNHDTPRVVTRLGGGEVGLAQAKALALLTHALPGNLYVYQGEELGLEDAPVEAVNRQDPIFFRTKGEQLGRDGVRVPIPWEGDQPPFGFATSNSWLPAPADWKSLSVAVQQTDPNSTLKLYQHSLRIRHHHPALGGISGINWIESSADLVHFRREPGFELIANTGSVAVRINTDKKLLLASSEVVLEDGVLEIPVNCTVWLTS